MDINDEIVEEEKYEKMSVPDLIKRQLKEGLIKDTKEGYSKRQIVNEQQGKFYSYEGSTAPNVLEVISANQWVRSSRWAAVRSSNVAAIKYDKQNKQLWVAFDSGWTYLYSDVSEQEARNMFQCDSMGQYVHVVLKGKKEKKRF